MKLHPTTLPGVALIEANRFEDHRGLFVKPFNRQMLSKHDIEFEPREEFYSVSRLGVIRGMHLQLPPAEQWKLVFCVSGRILDAVVDLRREEPTFGHHFCLELSADNNRCLFIPPGVAHGFCALDDNAIVYYCATKEYDATTDSGVRWDSFGMSWPVSEPILSTRDLNLPKFVDFQSPF